VRALSAYRWGISPHSRLLVVELVVDLSRNKELAYVMELQMQSRWAERNVQSEQ
jgi:hypothetical protein